MTNVEHTGAVRETCPETARKGELDAMDVEAQLREAHRRIEEVRRSLQVRLLEEQENARVLIEAVEKQLQECHETVRSLGEARRDLEDQYRAFERQHLEKLKENRRLASDLYDLSHRLDQTSEVLAEAQAELTKMASAREETEHELEKSRRAFDAAQRELKNARRAFDATQCELSGVYASASWRLTSPLRRMKALLHLGSG